MGRVSGMPKLKAKRKRNRPSGGPLRIPPQRKIPDDTASLRFSFEFLEVDSNQRFRLDACSKEFLHCLLTALRDLSKLTAGDLLADWADSYRAHRIDFDETTEPNGFSQLGEQLATDEAWQFRPHPHKKWRAHGFLTDDVFFVVWLDPFHRLYSKSGK